MKDFSQGGEQAVILKYFGAEPAAFLSIGENDGQTFSNVRALALLGWGGTCIEPAPTAFSKLAELYSVSSAVQCVQAAITTRDGPIDFYDSGTHLKKGDTSLLSTTRPGEMVKWKRSGETFTRTTVRGITFATLLSECGLTLSRVPDYTDAIPPDVARFDFISIDCEGADWEITKQIDLTAVGCRMLCVEGNHSPDRQNFIDYAAKHGMKLHFVNYENLIFARV